MVFVKRWGVHFSPYIENEVLEILSLRHFLISVSEPINTKQKYILVGVQIKCRCNPFDSLFVVQHNTMKFMIMYVVVVVAAALLTLCDAASVPWNLQPGMCLAWV